MRKFFPLAVIGIVLLFLVVYVRENNLTNSTSNVLSSQSFPSPTIEIFFDGKLDQPRGSITLLATGDVIPARSVNVNTIKRGNFMWPYEKVADFVKNADITLIDLETPLFDQCPQTQEGFKFCGEDAHIIGLAAMGVDMANIANNHSGNYGEQGLQKTIALLDSHGVQSSGYSKVAYKTVNGVKFAFLGYNDVGIDLNEQQVVDAIKEARKNADIVVVSYHWGTEYKTQPDQRQIDLAHLTIDSGADLVIGNHPHWIQPLEIYKDKLIMYAHGNFIFDQMWSEETKKGVVGKYVFVGNKLVDAEYYPIYIRDYGQPSFLEGTEKEKILSDLESSSFELRSHIPQ